MKVKVPRGLHELFDAGVEECRYFSARQEMLRITLALLLDRVTLT